MAANDTDRDTLGEQINDLYWTSNQTIDEITDRLEISRSSLYSSVRPTPTGHYCSDCGDRLVFTNRTNRASGTATCTRCGAEETLNTDRDGYDADPVRATAAARGPNPPEESRTQPRFDPGQVLLIGGAAALGVLAGVIVVRALSD